MNYGKMLLVAPIRSFGDTTNVSIAAFKKNIYVAYADASGMLAVARRDWRTGVWTQATKIAPTLAGVDHSHNQIEVAVDGAGYIHCWYGMHNNETEQYGMRYVRSNNPDDVLGGFTSRSGMYHGGEFPPAAYSYPHAVTAPNGDVYLAIRQDNKRLPLFHWNGKGWLMIANFADGTPEHNGGEKYVPYFPRLYAASDGSIHIKWEWAKDEARGERHQGCYAIYKPKDGKFYRADGNAYKLPITVASADVFQPRGSPWEQEGIALGDIAVDRFNQPVISYTFSPTGANKWEHRVARWNGSRWEQVALTERTNKWYRTFLVSHPQRLYCYMRMIDGSAQCVSYDQGRSWSTPFVVNDGPLDGAIQLAPSEHVLLHLGLAERNVDTEMTYLQIR